MKRLASVALGLVAIVASPVFAQISIYPPNPRLNETVRVQAPQGIPTSEILDFRATQVSMEANRITVSLVSAGTAPTLPEPSAPVDVPLGQFPAGDYSVLLQVVSQSGAVIRTLGSASFSILPKSHDDPLWNLTDLWWDPNESGWGINIVQHASGIIFATWFVYDPDGSPTWYVIPQGTWAGSGTGYVGPIYRTSGPTFCFDGQPCPGLPFDSSKVQSALVGQGSISIDPNNFDRAIISLTVDGKTVTRIVQRQSF